MFEKIVAKFRAESLNNRIYKRYDLVAILIRSKTVINHGFNDYNRTYIDGKSFTTYHAEHSCCRKFSNIKDKLLVLRFNRNGDLRNASPCEVCKEMLMKKGLRYIYCSDDNGCINKIDLFLLEKYLSLSQRNVINAKYSSTPSRHIYKKI
jgi:deoxycytidylate deaminase